MSKVNRHLSNLEQQPFEACIHALEEAKVQVNESVRGQRGTAFTLIELLVVISIIGVLAALIVGLTGLATRKSKEARVKIELTKLVNDIESYKDRLGFYPPDHRPPGVADLTRPSIPSPNQLFYELSGMIYQNNQFYVVGRQEPISPTSVQAWFGSSGFGNAARVPNDLQFKAEFKASQFKRILNPPIDVLVSPVRGPTYWELNPGGGIKVNPWLYVSTAPTNNTDRFDLWTEVIISGKLMRFSNWETTPVVLSP